MKIITVEKVKPPREKASF